VFVSVLSREAPLVAFDAGEREIPPEKGAIQFEGQEVFTAIAAPVRSTINDSDLARSFLDGTFVGEEPQRMIEDLHGPDFARQTLRRLILYAECDQDAILFEHEVPVDAFRRRVFLNHKPVAAHESCTPF